MEVDYQTRQHHQRLKGKSLQSMLWKEIKKYLTGSRTSFILPVKSIVVSYLYFHCFMQSCLCFETVK